MRMEVTDFAAVLFNPVAQAKFVHTVSAGYVLGAVFVMSISAFYLLRGRHADLAKRSMAVAASFGLAAALSVVVLGDESGYVAGENQKMKLAAIEAMWETEPAPAGFTAFAIPDQEARANRYAVHIPWVMGLIGTRSFNTEIPGIGELVERAEGRIRNGQLAYAALQQLRANREDMQAKAVFDQHWRDMGYALLLKRYREDIGSATDAEITRAAADTIPRVAPLFWSFRLMAGIGFYFIAFFALAFWLATVQKLDKYPWFLKLALYSLPLPWLAIEAGWLIAEYGRQPWAIDGVLPTFMAASGLQLHQVVISLTGFVLVYTTLAVIDVYLLRKVILKGPDDVPGGERRPDQAGTPLAPASTTVA
jgi:cytochrome d ubiquinol oxidase subunit I